MIYRIERQDRQIFADALKRYKDGKLSLAARTGFLIVQDTEELKEIRKQLKMYAAVKYAVGQYAEQSNIMHAIGRLNYMKEVRLRCAK